MSISRRNLRKKSGATKRRRPRRPSSVLLRSLYFIGVESLRPFTPDSDAECPTNLSCLERVPNKFPNKRGFKKYIPVTWQPSPEGGCREMGNCAPSARPRRSRSRSIAVVGSTSSNTPRACSNESAMTFFHILPPTYSSQVRQSGAERNIQL